MTNITPITISFPNWFYAILSLGILGLCIYIGIYYGKVLEICKQQPKIISALTRISEILLQRKLSAEYVFAQSPIKLTEEGIIAVKTAGFYEFYEENKNLIRNRLKNYNIKTMPDLEEACKEIMLNIEDNLPKFETIKLFAYNNGQPISQILFACAIALRDILKEELSL